MGVGVELNMEKVGPLIPAILWMSPNLRDPNPELHFEFDATPTLLEGFGFVHPNVQYKEIAHPKGTSAVVSNWDSVACADREKVKALLPSSCMSSLPPWDLSR